MVLVIFPTAKPLTEPWPKAPQAVAASRFAAPLLAMAVIVATAAVQTALAAQTAAVRTTQAAMAAAVTEVAGMDAAVVAVIKLITPIHTNLLYY